MAETLQAAKPDLPSHGMGMSTGGACKAASTGHEKEQLLRAVFAGFCVRAGRVTASSNEVALNSSYCWEYAKMALPQDLE